MPFVHEEGAASFDILPWKPLSEWSCKVVSIPAESTWPASDVRDGFAGGLFDLHCMAIRRIVYRSVSQRHCPKVVFATSRT
jgi:hypothetical protein